MGEHFAHRLAGWMQAAVEAEDQVVEVPAAELAWLARLAAGMGPAAQALEARNALLREAAGLVDGTTWAKATVLAAVAGGLPPENPRLAELVAAASEFAPLPEAIRSYYRVLE